MIILMTRKMNKLMKYIQALLTMLLTGSLLFVSCRYGNQHEPGTHSLTANERMIARADSLEFDTPYEIPPEDTLSLHAAGFAKILCSAVFITGLDFEFAAENIGYFTAPYEIRSHLDDRVLDVENKAVHITLPNGIVRTARYYRDQGCICLPVKQAGKPDGGEDLNFLPRPVESKLPDPESMSWPMGDVIPASQLPEGVDRDLVERAINTAFRNPEALTAAYVVTYKGEIIGERYREGISMNTSLESWSMGKSTTATLLGILMQHGIYTLGQAAPIPEWQQSEDDPRAGIKISDLLQMSSGLRFRAPLDPDFDRTVGYPDHIYVYTNSVNTFHWTANRPQQWPPGKVGRYRNCDPVLVNYLVRLGVEKLGKDYLSFPQHALFDKIGIRNMIIETDSYGNFLAQGYDFGTARDWARLGNLYLNDGVWMGERILPEGFVEFVSSLAPAWLADDRPIYGGFFWINGDRSFPVPENAYYMAGAGGQYVMIIPSHELVVVKLSHYKGGGTGLADFKRSLEILIDAVPEK
jgi:CubicO group peptidase (beta-lactamase class C family)